jgi:large subunit ribosomal protein L3
MSLRKLMGKKRGMIQLFDEKGEAVVCTVIEAEPNVVAQIKTTSTDGYNAIQIGFEQVRAKNPQTREKRVSKPLRGHYKAAGTEPRRHLTELRLDSVEEYTLGQELNVTVFADVPFVDVMAISKGKGFQGVMRLHNFAGGPAAHGSGFHRHAGATGMRSTPGRCFKGGKRASHMGLDRVTVQNLKVVAVKEAENLLIVRGQVPGPKNGLVYVTNAIKKPAIK